MHREITNLINQKLNKQIALEIPKDLSLGHFALPTFSFAKELKKILC